MRRRILACLLLFLTMGCQKTEKSIEKDIPEKMLVNEIVAKEDNTLYVELRKEESYLNWKELLGFREDAKLWVINNPSLCQIQNQDVILYVSENGIFSKIVYRVIIDDISQLISLQNEIKEEETKLTEDDKEENRTEIETETTKPEEKPADKEKEKTIEKEKENSFSDALAEEIVCNPDYYGYSCESIAALYLGMDIIDQRGEKVTSLKKGDLIAYFDSDGNYRHTAVYLGEGWILSGHHKNGNAVVTSKMNIYPERSYFRITKKGNLSYGRFVCMEAETRNGDGGWLAPYKEIKPVDEKIDHTPDEEDKHVWVFVEREERESKTVVDHYHCECGKDRYVLVELETACDHKYLQIYSQTANCIQKGYVVYRCEKCGDEYMQDIEAIQVDGHLFLYVETIAPTEESDGYDVEECFYCHTKRQVNRTVFVP